MVLLSDAPTPAARPCLATSLALLRSLSPRRRARRRIAEVRAALAFLHGQAKVHATLASFGLGDRDLTVTLSRAGRALATRQVRVEEGQSKAVELGFEPRDLGREVYSLSIDVDADDDVPENNQRAFLVRVARDRLPGAHVSGRPSWDQRFLRGFLKRDVPSSI